VDLWRLYWRCFWFTGLLLMTEIEYRHICTHLHQQEKLWQEEWDSFKNPFEAYLWWKTEEQKERRRAVIEYWQHAKATYERKR